MMSSTYTKAPTKTQLMKSLAQVHRTSPYARTIQSPSVQKGSHRAPDYNDYSVKFQHSHMYIRDQLNPQYHYRCQYTPELEIWLLKTFELNAACPPRYSAIRTTDHPTHRVLGADVKAYHQLRDSGFRYQEKFPHCIRLCLDGMGKTGSSNRPYALSLADFTEHFQTISLAYRGEKKAKLCVYEQPAHKPRIDWLRQMCQLVYGGAYDSSRYEVRYLHFNGHELVEVPQAMFEQSLPHTFATPAPVSRTAPQRSASRSLECDEELSMSGDESDTIASGLLSRSPSRGRPGGQDSQETVSDDELMMDHPAAIPQHQPPVDRPLHSPVFNRSASQLCLTFSPAIESGASTGLNPTPSTSTTFHPFASFTSSLSQSRPLLLTNSLVPPSMTFSSFGSSPLVNANEPSEDTVLLDQAYEAKKELLTHSQARLDSSAFHWLPKSDSIAHDTHSFFQQQFASNQSNFGSSPSTTLFGSPAASPSSLAILPITRGISHFLSQEEAPFA